MIKRFLAATYKQVTCALVTKACDWCKKERRAFLIFFKPRSWIKHRTCDGIDMVFCSLACFKAFTGTASSKGSISSKKPIEKQEEQLLAPVAR